MSPSYRPAVGKGQEPYSTESASPSYSLKIIEGYVGYERSLPEGRGDWAMARFIEATETEYEEERGETMDEILAYNLPALGAQWALTEGLDQHAPGPAGGQPGGAVADCGEDWSAGQQALLRRRLLRGREEHHLDLEPGFGKALGEPEATVPRPGGHKVWAFAA